MERDAGGAPHAVCRRRGKNEDQRRAPRAHVLLPERRLASTHAEGCRLCSPEEGTERADGTGKAENQHVRRRRTGAGLERGARPVPGAAPGSFPGTPGVDFRPPPRHLPWVPLQQSTARPPRLSPPDRQQPPAGAAPRPPLTPPRQQQTPSALPSPPAPAPPAPGSGHSLLAGLAPVPHTVCPLQDTKGVLRTRGQPRHPVTEPRASPPPSQRGVRPRPRLPHLGLLRLSMAATG